MDPSLNCFIKLSGFCYGLNDLKNIGCNDVGCSFNTPHDKTVVIDKADYPEQYAILKNKNLKRVRLPNEFVTFGIRSFNVSNIAYVKFNDEKSCYVFTNYSKRDPAEFTTRSECDQIKKFIASRTE